MSISRHQTTAEMWDEYVTPVFNGLCQIAESPGIVMAEYGFMSYEVHGLYDLVPGLDQDSLAFSLSQMESQKIEIVQDKTFAHVYIPDYLIQPIAENWTRLGELRSMPYPEYLETWEWKAKVKLVRLRDSDQCTMCQRSVEVAELHVHHKTYKRRGFERLSDLTTLCSSCHHSVHRHELEEK